MKISGSFKEQENVQIPHVISHVIWVLHAVSVEHSAIIVCVHAYVGAHIGKHICVGICMHVCVHVCGGQG